MRWLARARRLARLASVLMLGLTLWASAGTRSKPYTLIVERFRAYALISHAGMIRLSVAERLRSEHGTGAERPIAYSPTWRIRPASEGTDQYFVRLALLRSARGPFAIARDVYG